MLTVVHEMAVPVSLGRTPRPCVIGEGASVEGLAIILERKHTGLVVPRLADTLKKGEKSRRQPIKQTICNTKRRATCAMYHIPKQAL